MILTQCLGSTESNSKKENVGYYDDGEESYEDEVVVPPSQPPEVPMQMPTDVEAAVEAVAAAVAHDVAEEEGNEAPA